MKIRMSDAANRWYRKTVTTSWDLHDMLCAYIEYFTKTGRMHERVETFVQSRMPEAGWAEDWPNGEPRPGLKTVRQQKEYGYEWSISDEEQDE